jgi:hypothetical protein
MRDVSLRETRSVFGQPYPVKMAVSLMRESKNRAKSAVAAHLFVFAGPERLFIAGI